MTISATTENAILNLVYCAAAWAGYADNAAAAAQTNIHVGLHTADPLDAGDMTTSEANYSNYARVNVPRNSTASGWLTSTAGSISPQVNIDFPSSGAAGTTVTFFSTGKTGGGAQPILWSGGVSPSIAIGASGVIPRLTPATTITLE